MVLDRLDFDRPAHAAIEHVHVSDHRTRRKEAFLTDGPYGSEKDSAAANSVQVLPCLYSATRTPQASPRVSVAQAAPIDPMVHVD